MQQPPPGQGWPPQLQPQQGYGQPPTNYGQPPSPYPPQQGQWLQPYAPNPQWNQQPYGQTPPPPQPKAPKTVNATKSLVITFGILIAIIFLIIGFAALMSNTGHAPQSTLSEPDYKASTTDTTVAALDKDSNDDKGMNVHFTCTILNFVKDSNGNTAGANVDNTLASGIIQVIFPSGTDLSQLNTGDTLEVWGLDQGTFSGSNAFGATIQEVAIEAFYMTDQTTSYQTS